ncbi:hypothetical protein V2G26_019148 [Clonostachys chloroleuca]
MCYRTASNASESQTSEGVNQEQQLFNLCTSQGAITAACIARSAIKYGPFESNRDASLSAFQSFQCKLAQFCHNDSGGAANTSLVYLAVDGGLSSSSPLTSENRPSSKRLKEVLKICCDMPPPILKS